MSKLIAARIGTENENQLEFLNSELAIEKSTSIRLGIAMFHEFAKDNPVEARLMAQQKNKALA